jgi:hypothetical protein
MPSPPCNLRINRPTPTTVSFTVSTRAPLTTLTSRLIHYTALASRIIIAASIILILATKWCLWSTREGWNHLPTWLSLSLPGQGAKFVAENAMARYLLPVSLVVLWACARRGYTGMFISTSVVKHKFSLLLEMSIFRYGHVSHNEPMHRVGLEHPTSQVYAHQCSNDDLIISMF